MLKTDQIRIRDPFVYAQEGWYYLYGTVNEDTAREVYVFKSRDLCNWEEPQAIFDIADVSWAEKDLWAPELHVYQGKYYLFVSILGKNGLRGTQVAVSDTLDGKFIPVADRPSTPLEYSCIDGTLYIENDVPYMVYSHDWPDCFHEDKGFYVGEICAVELTEDLSEPKGVPFKLFASNEAKQYAPAVHEFLGDMVTRYGSDGPFLQKLESGKLLLTWSPIPDSNYIVAGAVSDSGSIHGPWRHLEKPIFDRNGGHAMLFTDLNGKKKMAIHYPERVPDERALFLDVQETDETIVPVL